MSKILHLPFDEADGSSVAHDWSPSHADAAVCGASFIEGKDGNAISFDGLSTCEVEEDVLDIAQEEWTITAWVCPTPTETGAPSRLIWILNFDADMENYHEVSIEATPGEWCHLIVTKSGNTFTFYRDAATVAIVRNAGTLLGVSLNQDYYGGDYGFGCLDDVVVYDKCMDLTDIYQMSDQAYYIDGVNLRDYGVFVSGSKGILNRPKAKTPTTAAWDDYHGSAVDLNNKFLDCREITLSCFIKASGKGDFIDKVIAFEEIFNKQGTNRLVIEAHPTKPLIYEVYCADQIDVDKAWSDDLMVGTFSLKLIEPEPVKRVLKHNGALSSSTCDILMDTDGKLVNVFWGDGMVDYDLCLSGDVISHEYADNGIYYPVITGDIDRIIEFETNASVVWDKL